MNKSILILFFLQGVLWAQNEYPYNHPYQDGYYNDKYFSGQGSYYQNNSYYLVPEGGYSYHQSRAFYDDSRSYTKMHPEVRGYAHHQDYSHIVEGLQTPQGRQHYYRQGGRRRYRDPDLNVRTYNTPIHRQNH